MLNDSAIKIIRSLKIEGGCNVQFALNPETSEYYLIEVNPRVSRSSALASKASGYPIARVTAKIAVGMTLDEIKIANTTAAKEPRLDYIVAKFPRFPFDKFTSASNKLGTQMKATGEVMGIGSNLEECMLKSVRSLETGVNHFYLAKFDNMTTEELKAYLLEFKDDNIFAIAELLRRGVSVDELHDITKITAYFLEAVKRIVDMEKLLKENKGNADVLRDAKKMGFCDKFIAKLWETDELSVCATRKANGIVPKTIIKSVRDLIEISSPTAERKNRTGVKMTKVEKEKEIARLEKQMKEAARMMEYEYAALLRDQIIELRGNGL